MSPPHTTDFPTETERESQPQREAQTYMNRDREQEIELELERRRVKQLSAAKKRLKSFRAKKSRVSEGEGEGQREGSEAISHSLNNPASPSPSPQKQSTSPQPQSPPPGVSPPKKASLGCVVKSVGGGFGAVWGSRGEGAGGEEEEERVGMGMGMGKGKGKGSSGLEPRPPVTDDGAQAAGGELFGVSTLSPQSALSSSSQHTLSCTLPPFPFPPIPASTTATTTTPSLILTSTSSASSSSPSPSTSTSASTPASVQATPSTIDHLPTPRSLGSGGSVGTVGMGFSFPPAQVTEAEGEGEGEGESSPGETPRAEVFGAGKTELRAEAEVEVPGRKRRGHHSRTSIAAASFSFPAVGISLPTTTERSPSTSTTDPPSISANPSASSLQSTTSPSRCSLNAPHPPLFSSYSDPLLKGGAGAGARRSLRGGLGESSGSGSTSGSSRDNSPTEEGFGRKVENGQGENLNTAAQEGLLKPGKKHIRRHSSTSSISGLKAFGVKGNTTPTYGSASGYGLAGRRDRDLVVGQGLFEQGMMSAEGFGEKERLGSPARWRMPSLSSPSHSGEREGEDGDSSASGSGSGGDNENSSSSSGQVGKGKGKGRRRGGGKSISLRGADVGEMLKADEGKGEKLQFSVPVFTTHAGTEPVTANEADLDFSFPSSTSSTAVPTFSFPQTRGFGSARSKKAPPLALAPFDEPESSAGNGFSFPQAGKGFDATARTPSKSPVGLQLPTVEIVPSTPSATEFALPPFSDSPAKSSPPSDAGSGTDDVKVKERFQGFSFGKTVERSGSPLQSAVSEPNLKAPLAEETGSLSPSMTLPALPSTPTKKKRHSHTRSGSIANHPAFLASAGNSFSIGARSPGRLNTDISRRNSGATSPDITDSSSPVKEPGEIANNRESALRSLEGGLGNAFGTWPACGGGAEGLFGRDGRRLDLGVGSLGKAGRRKSRKSMFEMEKVEVTIPDLGDSDEDGEGDVSSPEELTVPPVSSSLSSSRSTSPISPGSPSRFNLDRGAFSFPAGNGSASKRNSLGRNLAVSPFSSSPFPAGLGISMPPPTVGASVEPQLKTLVEEEEPPEEPVKEEKVEEPASAPVMAVKPAEEPASVISPTIGNTSSKIRPLRLMSMSSESASSFSSTPLKPQDRDEIAAGRRSGSIDRSRTASIDSNPAAYDQGLPELNRRRSLTRRPLSGEDLDKAERSTRGSVFGWSKRASTLSTNSFATSIQTLNEISEGSLRDSMDTPKALDDFRPSSSDHSSTSSVRSRRRRSTTAHSIAVTSPDLNHSFNGTGAEHEVQELRVRLAEAEFEKMAMAQDIQDWRGRCKGLEGELREARGQSASLRERVRRLGDHLSQISSIPNISQAPTPILPNAPTVPPHIAALLSPTFTSPSSSTFPDLTLNHSHAQSNILSSLQGQLLSLAAQVDNERRGRMEALGRVEELEARERVIAAGGGVSAGTTPEKMGLGIQVAGMGGIVQSQVQSRAQTQGQVGAGSVLAKIKGFAFPLMASTSSTTSSQSRTSTDGQERLAHLSPTRSIPFQPVSREPSLEVPEFSFPAAGSAAANGRSSPYRFGLPAIHVHGQAAGRVDAHLMDYTRSCSACRGEVIEL